MDECQFKLDKCEYKCTNTPGSYKCSCPYGKVLASNGYSCIKCSENKAITNFTQISPIMPKNIKENLWHVAICSDNLTICSGSLINDNLIITTANCVCNDNTISADSISVKMNKNYACPTEEISALEYGVSQIICHPMYNNTVKSEYNIALLRLTVIVNDSTFAPVCLPVPYTDTDILIVNNFVGIYGYREYNSLVSSGGSGSGVDHMNNSIDDIDELYYQVTQIVANYDCSVAYNYSLSIKNQVICTSKSIHKLYD